MESLCKGKKTKKIRKGCHITSLWKSKLNSQSQRTKKKDNTNRRKEIKCKKETLYNRLQLIQSSVFKTGPASKPKFFLVMSLCGSTGSEPGSIGSEPGSIEFT